MKSNLLLAALAAKSTLALKIPQTVELDLIFPRNETYAPLAYFPIIFAIQNAETAWPLDMSIDWRIAQKDSDEPVKTGYFPKDGYTKGIAPANPYFHFELPQSLVNNTEGEWVLLWQLSFKHNCSSKGRESSNPFYSQPRKEMHFRTAAGGKEPDIIKENACGQLPITVAIEQVFDTCPVLAETAPSADPCAVPIGSELVENVTALARNVSSCQDGSLSNISYHCSTSGGVRVESWGGLASVLLVSIMGMILVSL